MSLWFYQLGEQLTFPGPTREISCVRLHYSRTPRLSVTGQLSSKQSAVAFFTGCCTGTEWTALALWQRLQQCHPWSKPQEPVPGLAPRSCLLASVAASEGFCPAGGRDQAYATQQDAQNRRKPVSRTGKTFNFLCLLQMTDCNNPKM